MCIKNKKLKYIYYTQKEIENVKVIIEAELEIAQKLEV